MMNDRNAWNRGLMGPYDYTLLMVVLALLVIGLIVIYSATFRLAAEAFGDPGRWFRLQLTWAGLGLLAMYITSRIPYVLWRRLAVPGLLGTVALLVLVLVVGEEVNGSRRFLLSGRLQPSEVAKFTLVIYIALWLASRGDRLQDVSYGLIPFGVILGGLMGLIVLEPDFSTAILIGGIGMTVFFIAGADPRQLLISALAGALAFGLLIWQTGRGLDRWLQFVARWDNPASDPNSQVGMAMAAVAQGGLLGKGLGEFKIPVPLAQSDMIFAAVANQFGLLGVTVILFLFGLLAYRGYLIAARVPDAFASLVAAGVTTWLVLQALINMCVTINLLPSTGLPLPFVSYGGSSLVMSLASVGVVLHISQYVPTRSKRHAGVNLGRGNWGARVSRPDRVGDTQANT